MALEHWTLHETEPLQLSTHGNWKGLVNQARHVAKSPTFESEPSWTTMQKGWGKIPDGASFFAAGTSGAMVDDKIRGPAPEGTPKAIMVRDGDRAYFAVTRVHGEDDVMHHPPPDKEEAVANPEPVTDTEPEPEPSPPYRLVEYREGGDGVELSFLTFRELLRWARGCASSSQPVYMRAEDFDLPCGAFYSTGEIRSGGIEAHWNQRSGDLEKLCARFVMGSDNRAYIRQTWIDGDWVRHPLPGEWREEAVPPNEVTFRTKVVEFDLAKEKEEEPVGYIPSWNEYTCTGTGSPEASKEAKEEAVPPKTMSIDASDVIRRVFDTYPPTGDEAVNDITEKPARPCMICGGDTVDNATDAGDHEGYRNGPLDGGKVGPTLWGRRIKIGCVKCGHIYSESTRQRKASHMDPATYAAMDLYHRTKWRNRRRFFGAALGSFFVGKHLGDKVSDAVVQAAQVAWTWLV